MRWILGKRITGVPTLLEGIKVILLYGVVTSKERWCGVGAACQKFKAGSVFRTSSRLYVLSLLYFLFLLLFPLFSSLLTCKPNIYLSCPAPTYNPPMSTIHPCGMHGWKVRGGSGYQMVMMMARVMVTGNRHPPRRPRPPPRLLRLAKITFNHIFQNTSISILTTHLFTTPLI